VLEPDKRFFQTIGLCFAAITLVTMVIAASLVQSTVATRAAEASGLAAAETTTIR
jgi:hypothetical protein